MGPRGFFSELRKKGAAPPTLRGAAVERLVKGKTVAVDGAVWFYEAQLQEDVVRAFGPLAAVIKVTFERCVRWLRKGVLPVVVLEGSGGGRACRTFSVGHGSLGEKFAAQPRVRALLQALGVPFVNADGEAEATCAALVAAGACDFVATTDFDALLFGAPRVLRGLDLQATTAASKGELWEVSSIDKAVGLDQRGLIVAAVLSGCDYDCRGMLTQEDAEGVKGIGPRFALQVARSLRRDGDALDGLQKLLAGTLELDTGQDKLLARTMRKVGEQPGCADGLRAAVRQYTRVVDVQAFTDVTAPFAWAGVNEGAAAPILETVYPGKGQEKLDPLLLEWALRVVSQCPQSIRRDASERRKWAALQGLRYVPTAATKPKCLKEGVMPYALVDFELTEGDPRNDSVPLRLPADKRHARVSLAEACELFRGNPRSPKMLAVAFVKLLTECPEDVRRDDAALRTWALDEGMELVPADGKRMRSGRVKVAWCSAASGSAVDGAVLEVEAEQAARFGGKLAEVSGCNAAQRKIKDFFQREIRSGRKPSFARRSLTRLSAQRRTSAAKNRESGGAVPLSNLATRIAKRRSCRMSSSTRPPAPSGAEFAPTGSPLRRSVRDGIAFTQDDSRDEDHRQDGKVEGASSNVQPCLDVVSAVPETNVVKASALTASDQHAMQEMFVKSSTPVASDQRSTHQVSRVAGVSQERFVKSSTQAASDQRSTHQVSPVAGVPEEMFVKSSTPAASDQRSTRPVSPVAGVSQERFVMRTPVQQAPQDSTSLNGAPVPDIAHHVLCRNIRQRGLPVPFSMNSQVLPGIADPPLNAKRTDGFPCPVQSAPELPTFRCAEQGIEPQVATPDSSRTPFNAGPRNLHCTKMQPADGLRPRDTTPANIARFFASPVHRDVPTPVRVSERREWDTTAANIAKLFSVAPSRDQKGVSSSKGLEEPVIDLLSPDSASPDTPPQRVAKSPSTPRRLRKRFSRTTPQKRLAREWRPLDGRSGDLPAFPSSWTGHLPPAVVQLSPGGFVRDEQEAASPPWDLQKTFLFGCVEACDNADRPAKRLRKSSAADISDAPLDCNRRVLRAGPFIAIGAPGEYDSEDELPLATVFARSRHVRQPVRR